MALLNKWSAIPERIDQPELLDLNHGSLEEAHGNLAHIARFGRWLGGDLALRRFLFPLMRRWPRRPIRVLDLGSGSAAAALAMARWAERHGIDVHIVALDCNRRHLAAARGALAGQAGPAGGRIQLLAADALALPFRPGSFDFVVSSVFMHHFAPTALMAMLASLGAICRGTLVMHDLVRNQIPLLMFRLVVPLFTRNHLTLHDGAVSIRRAYTPREMRSIAAQAGLVDARVHTHGLLYRMTLVTGKAEP